ncbi:MAG TPA: DUF2520 domain-containing protein [Acidimicrobiia bacterium]|nr:DUF2520 domain-containing protein [Acidimicrobiia bacterium]
MDRYPKGLEPRFVDIIIAGPGRAGGALALAAAAVGHTIVGLVSRSEALGGQFSRIDYETPLPRADLLVVAVRDSFISEVANRLAPFASEAAAAVHLSGFGSVALLSPLGAAGVAIGSFHPLQTLPSPTEGARALAGSWVGVTAGNELRGTLWDFAATLSMNPFDLADDQKPAYHAAASAASNFVVAALGLSERLFAAAGVAPAAARPLTERVVANAYSLGAVAALTGPIARGDWPTVSGQVEAARAAGLGEAYLAMAQATANLANRELPTSVFRLPPS